MRQDTEKPLQHTYTKGGEIIWIYSMGKRFQMRAITTTVESANEYMDKHQETALIACFGPFNIIANKYEGVRDTNEVTTRARD